MTSADEMLSVGIMFQQVWGTALPVAGVELLRAIDHSGGYVAGAFDGEHLIGASVGFLARHHGDEALHSHITGILPGAQRTGIGRLIKDHQRAWAAERGIGWITWTFDPLVRRNAGFNIAVLQGYVSEYLINFYGQMQDSINTDIESDRVVIAWPTTDPIIPPTPPASSIRIEVPTPEDIVFLRRTDPDAAVEWRLRMRAELGERLAAGGVVTGFTKDGSYVLHVPDGDGDATPAA